MKTYIEKRVKDVARDVIASGCTVRQAAENFGVSKSTIHKDLTERLEIMDPKAAEQVAEILKFNKEQRHIRGGEATRLRYSNL